MRGGRGSPLRIKRKVLSQKNGVGQEKKGREPDRDELENGRSRKNSSREKTRANILSALLGMHEKGREDEGKLLKGNK